MDERSQFGRNQRRSYIASFSSPLEFHPKETPPLLQAVVIQLSWSVPKAPRIASSVNVPVTAPFTSTTAPQLASTDSREDNASRRFPLRAMRGASAGGGSLLA